jgi:hypothetical protein
MRLDTLDHEPCQTGTTPTADCDAYARAEHMLHCYGASYVCRHPELLIGRLPTVDLDDHVSPTRRSLLDECLGISGRPGPSDHHAYGGDLLLRVLGAYHLQEEIFALSRAPTRAETPSAKIDTSEFKNTGDHR